MNRIGSLFSGYGGLDMAVQAALGGEVAWHCEIEPAAARVLAHHRPGVPNLGDITTVDWSSVRRDAEELFILTGGFPCQDVSSAGRRAGLRPDTRSGLWTHMAYAIDQLRPDLVVIENVRGLTSADAACDLEPCPWCLGDDEGRPLRALGAVLGDLADLGYDARWCGLRAADVGAPHGRYRIFIVAAPSDTDSGDPHRRAAAELAGEAGPPIGPAADAGGGELQRRGVGGVLAGPEGAGEGEGSERQRDRHAAGDGGAAATDPVRDGREGRPERDLGPEAGQPTPLGRDAAGRVLDWGAYGPAIRRWELILDRAAPAPTQTGQRGGQQLSPLFVEWLMGLPAGHVTAVPGLSRNEQLKLLGNGVVPQQAAAALRCLLAVDRQVVAA